MGGLFSGLFGKPHKAVPQSSESKTGYEAMPQYMKNQIQAQMEKMYSGINGMPQLQAIYQQYMGDHNSPFYNPELAALQQAQGNIGVQQLGVQAGFNPWQQAAMQALGNPDFSQQGLSAYMQPTNAQRAAMEQALNEQFDKQKAQIGQQQAIRGNRINPFTSSAYQNRLDALEKNRAYGMANIAGQLERQGQQDALALRREALGGQMGVGETLQDYQQQQLNNAMGYNRTVNNPMYGQTAAMQQLWNPYLGAQSNVSQGKSPARPSTRDKYLNAFDKIGSTLVKAYTAKGGA